MHARQKATHQEFVCGDVRDLNKRFAPGQFDCCVALDLIEHLEKKDGVELMQSMERIAGRRVIFFTPNGFLPQKQTEHDDLQEHLSGWEVRDMEQRGYRVVGMFGPKEWRTEHHAMKMRPRWFWRFASLVAHYAWTRFHPETSAAILCVKDVN